MKRTVVIKSTVSTDLHLRDSADFVFNLVETYSENEIQMDFSDIQSISRSFAHQYLTRKKASKKIISEVNTPENVEKMFRAVKKTMTSSSRPRVKDLDSIHFTTIP